MYSSNWRFLLYLAVVLYFLHLSDFTTDARDKRSRGYALSAPLRSYTLDAFIKENSVLVEPVAPETKSSKYVVYVVDDDDLVRHTITESLRAHGYAPQSFESAADLLAHVSADDVGCVVTDLRMPSMDGKQLQRELRSQGSNLSLIILTAFATVPVAVELMKDGAATLLEKPCKVDVLTNEVAKAIGQSQVLAAHRLRVQNARRQIASLNIEELAVLDCASQGKPNKAISEELSISSRTVDRRRQSAMRKLSVESIAEFAVIRAEAEYPNPLLADEQPDADGADAEPSDVGRSVANENEARTIDENELNANDR